PDSVDICKTRAEIAPVLGNAGKAAPARNVCAVAQHPLDAMLAERNDPFRQVEVQDSRLADERLITRPFVDRLVVEKFGKPCPVPAIDATEQPFDKPFGILAMEGSDVHTSLALRHQ